MFDVLAAELTEEEARSLVFVFLASTLGAVLSRWHLRLVLPTVVVEIVLGILIGPEVLGLAEVDVYIAFLSDFGLALLFFFAGLEVIEHHVPRNALRRGTIGWGMSLAIGMAFGLLLDQLGVDVVWWLLAVALATTALGTLVPILSDAKLLPTELGRAVLGTGVAGEFWPIIFISVFLTGVYGAATEIVLLIVFALVVGGAAAVARRARPPRLLRIVRDTLHTTGQVGVRGVGVRPRAARVPRGRRGLRVRARRVRGGCPRRAGARLARREDRARVASRGSGSASSFRSTSSSRA